MLEVEVHSSKPVCSEGLLTSGGSGECFCGSDMEAEIQMMSRSSLVKMAGNSLLDRKNSMGQGHVVESMKRPGTEIRPGVAGAQKY